MKKRLTLFLLALCLLSAQPALAADQEITPGPGTYGAEGPVEVDMNIEEGFVVVIPGALTITPGVGGREYAVGEVCLTEVHLYGSRSLRLALPGAIRLDSAVSPGNRVEASPFIGHPGGGKKNETPLCLDTPVPISVSFAQHAFANAVAGSYQGIIRYDVRIVQEQ
ncbi:hypothetical protein [Eubacterium limosum]|uniref:hypothetical protein n=1 Tax=Eubacterium limosum TaxID=1736 RepID=UPI001063A79D|nr:hypothetical protein [Eubacterium limosum]